MTREDLLKYREDVREMFQHSYNSYLEHAYPYDELRPLSCDGVDTWGSYSLTLIDALDTLAVMGNHSEFRRSATPFCRFMFLLLLPVISSFLLMPWLCQAKTHLRGKVRKS